MSMNGEGPSEVPAEVPAGSEGMRLMPRTSTFEGPKTAYQAPAGAAGGSLY